MAQYQSQFVPTDFQTSGNILSMLRGDMKERDQEYDAGELMQSGAIAELGALESNDLEGKAERLSAIQKAMDDALARRGGDYGAAAKDFQRIVAQERGNPWYQINRRLTETDKERRKLELNADNIIIGDRINSVKDAEKAMAEGRDPFKLSALSRKESYARLADIFSNFDKVILEDPETASTMGGQYWQVMRQYGVDPKMMDEFLNTKEGRPIVDSFIASYPELGETNEKQVREIIKQAAYSAMGKTEIDENLNRQYIESLRNARTGNNESSIGSTYTGDPLVESSLDNKVRKEVESMSNIFDENGNATKKTKGITVTTGTDFRNVYTSTDAVGRANETFNNYKKEYGAVYDAVKKNGGTDKDFIAIAAKLKLDQAYVLESKERLNNASFNEDFRRTSKNLDKMFKEGSYTEFFKKFKDSGVKPEDVGVFFTVNGDMQIADPKGKTWTINKDSMSDVYKLASRVVGDTYSDFYNYKVSKEDVEKINNKDNWITNNKSVRVVIDPDNPLQRVIVMYERDKSGEMVPTGRVRDIKDLQRRMMKLIDEDARNSGRTPKVDTD